MGVKAIWARMNLVRSVPALIAYHFLPSNEMIKQDINVWSNNMNLERLSTVQRLNWLLVFYPEFRNLFYHRIRKHNLILSKFLHLFYWPLSSLYIQTQEIGGGLFIQHGFSTIIAAKSIGKNCWINQQVTIGFSKNSVDHPIIGDNVKIGAGAIAIGKMTIGDNSLIGAGSVVVKDVPPNCTLVGNPGRIIKKDGVKIDKITAG